MSQRCRRAHKSVCAGAVYRPWEIERNIGPVTLNQACGWDKPHQSPFPAPCFPPHGPSDIFRSPPPAHQMTDLWLPFLARVCVCCVWLWHSRAWTLADLVTARKDLNTAAAPQIHTCTASLYRSLSLPTLRVFLEQLCNCVRKKKRFLRWKQSRPGSPAPQGEKPLNGYRVERKGRREQTRFFRMALWERRRRRMKTFITHCFLLGIQLIPVSLAPFFCFLSIFCTSLLNP